MQLRLLFAEEQKNVHISHHKDFHRSERALLRIWLIKSTILWDNDTIENTNARLFWKTKQNKTKQKNQLLSLERWKILNHKMSSCLSSSSFSCNSIQHPITGTNKEFEESLLKTIQVILCFFFLVKWNTYFKNDVVKKRIIFNACFY